MEAAALFRLLGDDARLRLLRLLDAERLNVGELTSILGIAQSGVSRHLRILHDAGFVALRPDGQRRLYSLRPERFRELDRPVPTRRRRAVPPRARTSRVRAMIRESGRETRGSRPAGGPRASRRSRERAVKGRSRSRWREAPRPGVRRRRAGRATLTPGRAGEKILSSSSRPAAPYPESIIARATRRREVRRAMKHPRSFLDRER